MKTKIVLTLIAVLGVSGFWGLKKLDHWATSEAYPDIWNKPEALRNYRLKVGHVAFVFPETARVLSGSAQAESEHVVRHAKIKGNEIDFSRIRYGKYEFDMEVLFQNSTNSIRCNHYHSPNWSRDKIIIKSLNPLEYEYYTNGEQFDIKDAWTTITNRTSS